MLIPPASIRLQIPVILVGLILSCGLSSGADDAPFWPQFNGPRRDNRSTETGLLKRWPEEGPDLLWTAEGIGHGFSTVSIADGMIYTTGNIEDDTVITALDLDGGSLWRASNGRAWHRPHGGTRGTPTIDGDRLYHESALGDVVCLEAETGKKIWGLNILEKFHSKNITWALAESVLIDGDRVICCPGGPETCMVALDKRTGRVVWTAPSTGDLAGYASPVLVEYQGLRMILTMTSRAVIGVNADTGALLWRFPRTVPWKETIFTPLFHEGHVFISTAHRTGSVKLKLSVDGDQASVKEVWQTDELDNQHGGVMLVDGYLYGSCHTSNAAKWVCLDWKTGRTMWVDRAVGRGSLTCADGMLYLLSQKSKVGLLQPSPDGCRLVSQFRLPPGGEGPSWAHPVVCGGRLYIRHGNRLYAYDVKVE